MTYCDGDRQFDCVAILEELYRLDRFSPSERARRWEMLWPDLIARSEGLELRKSLLKAGLWSQLPISERPKDWIVSMHKSVAVDVVIFCVLESEFNATLAGFGVNQTEVDIEHVTGHPFVRLSFVTKYCGTISVCIGLVGEARTVSCAHFCRDVFEKFDIRLCCILVGICAGHEEVLKIGDVIGAKTVWDIEGARVEPDETKPRPRPYALKGTWREAFSGYNPERWKWLEPRTDCVEVMKASRTMTPPKWQKIVPTYKTGSIATGERLRRDDPLPELKKRFDDDILGLEMEGAGFASACERKGLDWLVFRGVSDYGDMRKNKTWQPMAALHAALAARSFLHFGLRSKEETISEIPF